MSQIEVIKQIYKNQYLDNMSAEQGIVSSHWLKYGDYNVRFDGDTVELKGGGFGDFRKDTYFNKVRYFQELRAIEIGLRKFERNVDIFNVGQKVAQMQGRLFDFDCQKQLMALSDISKHYDISSIKKFCVIGDGYGYLSSVLKKLFPESTVIVVNLGKTLFFDAHYISQVFPKAKTALYQEEGNSKDDLDFLFLEAENYLKLSELGSEFFFNIASFQEMEPETVSNYFEQIMKSSGKKFLYCCNRDEKFLPSGAVNRFKEFGVLNAQKKFFLEHCSWYDELFINRYPWVAKYDGSFSHCFVEFM